MLANKRTIVYALLISTILLAAFLRIWKLDALPPGLYHDEAYNGLDALSLIQGKSFPQFYEGWELYAEDAHSERPPLDTRFPVFFEGNYGREPLHIYLMALSILIFDVTPFAIRIIPALAGTLAVLTTFLATRALFRSHGIAVPLFAAFLLAIMYPTLHFSRFGIRAILFVPVETCAVASFWAGINRGEQDNGSKKGAGVWFWFLLAGVLLGLAVYTFAAARLFPLVWVMFIPVWFWMDRDASSRFWKQVMGMVGAALLTALPLITFFIQYPYYFVFRIAYVANKGKGAVEGKPWLTWIFNIGRVLRGLVLFGETHLRHNLPGRPYLDLIQSLLSIVGLVLTLRRIFKPRFLFLLLWFLIMLLPSILSGDAPHFGRLSGAAAPMAIMGALGANYFIGKVTNLLWRKLSPKHAEVTAYGLIVTLFLVSTIATFYDYFYRYAGQPRLAEDFYEPEWEIGRFAASQGADLDVYLTPTQEELATILFALGDPDRLRNYDGSGSLVPTGRSANAALYLVRNSESKAETLNQLDLMIPSGTILPGGLDYDVFYVAEDTSRIKTNYVADTWFGDQIRLIGWSKEIKDGQLFVTLAWQAEKDIERNYTAFVHLLGEESELIAQQDRQPAGYPTSDWRVGEVIIDRYTIALPSDFYPNEDYSLITGFYHLPDMEWLGEVELLEDR
ncbi:MAG: hypothetical protein R3293_06455 [Candidatus Promineifilaceae bacterium]|nr:hypothetical protein [Candidatus Promineifilaceae bacterium]